jgi:hypothetical protein
VTGVWFGNDDFSEMNKVTGGLLPAAAWKNVMLTAEESKTAAALPGVPLDASYARYVAENQPAPDIAAPPAGTNGETPPVGQTDAAKQASIGDVAGTRKILAPKSVTATRVSLTNPEEDVVVVRPHDQGDPVVQVIRDMFGLFGSDSETPRQTVRNKKRPGILVLPDANAGRTRSVLRTRSGTDR